MASLLDPLPLYTPRQAPTTNLETASIRSGAPSYTSDVPSYHSSASRRTSVHSDTSASGGTPPAGPSSASTTKTKPARIGLPRMDYAPGFHYRPVPSPDSGTPLESFPSGSSACCEGSVEQSTIPKVDVSRHRQFPRQQCTDLSRKGRAVISIALESSKQHSASRVSRYPPPSASIPCGPGRPLSMESTLLTSASPSISTAGTMGRLQQMASSTSSPQQETPVSPLEDPELVGPAAADMARKQRLFLADVRRGDVRFTEEETAAMRRQEAKTWDFMIAQMADWEERDRSWQRYSNRLGNERSRIINARRSLRRASKE